MNEPASFGTNEERPFNWPEDDKPYWSLNCSLEGNTLEHPPYRTSKWGYCFVSLISQKMINHTGVSIVHWKATP